jgi:uncharacterized membrane protein (DUF485 family)
MPSERTDFHRVAEMPAFRALIAAKRRFVVPATIFFIVYYFALLVLVGYFPAVMATPVLGPVNIAYLFALSQFFVAWFLAWLYLRMAAKWDAEARMLLSKLDDGGDAASMGRKGVR